MALDLTKLNNTATTTVAANTTAPAGVIADPFAKQTETKQAFIGDFDGLVALNSKKDEFQKLPAGKYIAAIEKIKVNHSSSGKPMFALQYRILDGEYANRVETDWKIVKDDKGNWNEFNAKALIRTLKQFTDIFSNETAVLTFIIEAIKEFEEQDSDLAIVYEDFAKTIGTLSITERPLSEEQKAKAEASGKSTEPYRILNFTVNK